MTLLAVLVMLLLGFSVLALAFGSAEPPHEIQTLGRSSPEEQAFERRAMRLQVIGFASVGVAVLVGLIGALELIV
jgi:hypothetical protein